MKKVDLTTGKVSDVLLRLAIPIMGSSLLQFTYNFVDMLWVGGLGSDAVASIGASSFYTGLGYSINTLLVIGTGIKAAHAIGKQDQESFKQYVRTGLYLNTLIGLIYAVILISLGRYMIDFLGMNNRTVEEVAYQYLACNGPILFFSFFNAIFTRVLGSCGDTKSPLKISALGIILNIILDPLLIYGLKLGVVGAALATLIAHVLMLILYLKVSKGLFHINFHDKLEWTKVKEITRLGLPIALQRIVFTLVNISLAKMIAYFGSEAIAAQKIGLQIEAITYMVTGGLNGAVASFVGQNFGAKVHKRIKEGYQVAIKMSTAYAVLTTTIFLLCSGPLAYLFVREVEVIAITESYLHIIAISQLFNAVEMVSSGLFTGLGYPKIPAQVSMLFTLLRLPMALIFIDFIGLNGIWLSISISTILKGMTLYSIYHLKIKNKILVI